MIIPEKIKAGNPFVLIGPHQKPPYADCRVIPESLYQYLVKLVVDIRQADIDRKITGETMLPQHIRERINEFLTANEL